MNRKVFLRRLLSSSALLLGGSKLWASLSRSDESIPGAILGADHQSGHLLRSNPAPADLSSLPTDKTQVLIVGAGVSGLAAARHLKTQGISDLRILELHSEPGGNSLSGQNEISAYPWGAHYLPLPNPRNEDLLDFLTEIGVRGRGNHYDERYLCHSPQERLLIHGRWQDGLIPQFGLGEQDKAQVATFLQHMQSLRESVCEDGREAFSLPVDLSSENSAYRSWDRLSMAEWMEQYGYRSPYLQWYVNYCTRDDFGLKASDCSAWAGIHYFAGRKGTAANAATNSVLVWPEGNAWLIRQLLAPVKEQLRCRALVSQIIPGDQEAEVIWMDLPSKSYRRTLAEHVVFAGPHFVGKRLIRDLPKQSEDGFYYAPWVVANVSLLQRPGGRGRPLSWDNVSYNSPSLGYVVADHQSLLSHPQKQTVLTWYHALSDQNAVAERQAALKRDYAYWQNLVVQDLESMHPGIRPQISRIDVWIWGHGMISPRPGAIWGGARQKAQIPMKSVHFAHTDLSGLSTFEEGFYQGLRAAREILNGS